jgi:hypothetical protein
MTNAELIMFVQTFVPCVIKCAMNATWRFVASSGDMENFIRYWIRVVEAGYQPYLYYTVNR